MSLRQLALGLLRQRGYVMPEDSDSNVVKIVIDEERCIPLIVRQSMAEVATGFSIEQFPTAFGRVADGDESRHGSTAGDCCAAGFSIRLRSLWVNSAADHRCGSAAHVRFTPKADK
jgi:hypothetical protein